MKNIDLKVLKRVKMESYNCENSVRIRRGMRNNKKNLDLFIVFKVTLANERQGEIL